MKQLFTGNIHFDIFFGLLLVAVASLPFTNWLLLPVAVAMLLNWLVEWNWKEKWHFLKTERNIFAFIIFSLFFYLALYGLFFSFNKSKAVSCFDCYLWFAIAPLILLTTNPQLLNRKRIQMTLAVFALSTTLCVIVLFIMGIYHMAITGNEYYMYYVKFSLFRHPSYMAMYATSSISLLFYFFWKKRNELAVGWKIGCVITVMVLLAGIVHLQSKAGLIVLVMTLITWFVFFICHLKYKFLWIGLLLLLSAATSFVVFKTDLIRYNRIKDLVGVTRSYKANPYGRESSQVRLTLWKTAWEVSCKNLPWGVGTGDAWDEMQVHAVYKNYPNIIGRGYNAHNQYLQTLLEAGIPGILVLLSFCGYPFVRSIREKDILYLLFSIMLILNLMVECMFEARAGVGFFALMNVLLFLRMVRE